MTPLLAPVSHAVILVGLPPAITLGLSRIWRPEFRGTAGQVSRIRLRILRASLRIEFFLAYSFLLLGPQYELFARVCESLGRPLGALLFSIPPFACYALGSATRAAVDARARRLPGTLLAHWKIHGLLLALRMGLYILVIPAFFLPFYDVSSPPWAPLNLLGFTLISLLYFIYVLRGMNVVLRVFGRVEPLDDPTLRAEMISYAGRNEIPLVDVGVLRTSARSVANAFAHFGSNRIVVTDRLQAVLSREELRAVLYHEVGHLGQWATNLTRLFSSYVFFLVYVYLRPLIEAAAGRRIGLGFVTLFFGGFLALLVVFRLVFGRFIQDSEARADLLAVEEGGGRRLYAEALRKIHDANMLPWEVDSSRSSVEDAGAMASPVQPLEASEGEGWV